MNLCRVRERFFAPEDCDQMDSNEPLIRPSPSSLLKLFMKLGAILKNTRRTH